MRFGGKRGLSLFTHTDVQSSFWFFNGAAANTPMYCGAGVSGCVCGVFILFIHICALCFLGASALTFLFFADTHAVCAETVRAQLSFFLKNKFGSCFK